MIDDIVGAVAEGVVGAVAEAVVEGCAGVAETVAEVCATNGVSNDIPLPIPDMPVNKRRRRRGCG